MAESLDLPCRYQSAGCHDIFPYYRKLKHEKHCRFRPYKCPYAGSECCVTGDIPALVNHLREDHKVDMHHGCTFNHRYVKSDPQQVENATWMLTVSYFSLSFSIWWFHHFGQRLMKGQVQHHVIRNVRRRQVWLENYDKLLCGSWPYSTV